MASIKGFSIQLQGGPSPKVYHLHVSYCAPFNMSRWLKVLVVVMAIIAVSAVSIAWYVSQYDNLELDIDVGQSTHSYPTSDTIELRLVIALTNTGSVELYVPPTTFDLRVDGVDAGPGESEAVTVPAGGKAWSTAVVTIDRAIAPLAYLALIDPGQDKITMKGEAHVEVGPFTLDFPFEESFTMDV
jgi:LEA14-like dessication related protein